MTLWPALVTSGKNSLYYGRYTVPEGSLTTSESESEKTKMVAPTCRSSIFHECCSDTAKQNSPCNNQVLKTHSNSSQPLWNHTNFPWRYRTHIDIITIKSAKHGDLQEPPCFFVPSTACIIDSPRRRITLVDCVYLIQHPTPPPQGTLIHSLMIHYDTLITTQPHLFNLP